MIISRAGFFRELPHGLPHGDSLVKAVGAGDRSKEAKLVPYLWEGTVLAASGCLVDDLLDPAVRGVAPLELVTDGAWAWPRDLAYYVERYHVRVPLTFVLHLELRDWAQPELSPDELNEVEATLLSDG